MYITCVLDMKRSAEFLRDILLNTDVSASGSSLTGVFCVKGSVLHAK